MGASTLKAQQILQESSPGLAVDGIWGRRTQAAYDAAPADVKARVSKVFTADGKLPPWAPRWITRDEVDVLVARACSALNVEHYTDSMRKFVDLEARKSSDGKMYDINSVNGGSRGLMQMQRAAWQDAMKETSELKSYASVFDPYQNILAGVAYAKINARWLARRGIAVNTTNLYLAHNQGLGYFTGSRTAVEKQSKKVQALINGRATIE